MQEIILNLLRVFNIKYINFFKEILGIKKKIKSPESSKMIHSKILYPDITLSIQIPIGFRLNLKY